MRYDDFVIQLRPGRNGDYEMEVRSPAGEGRGTFRVPPGFAGMETVAEAMGYGRDLTPKVPPREPRFAAREIGGSLFRALFSEQVLALYHESLASLWGDPARGLRIKLNLNLERYPELAALQNLPWELLRRSDTDDFLGLSRQTPIVRYLDVPRPQEPSPLPERLHILAVVSNPRGLPPLDLAKERLNLVEAWQGKEAVTFLEEASLEALHQAALKTPFQVLHYMGHGGNDPKTGEGVLFFQAADGSPHRVTGRELATELKDFKSLRLVFLNACSTAGPATHSGIDPFAGVATALVKGGTPAALAMRFPISDRAAIAFGRTVYQRIAAGDAIDTAVAEGRLAVHRLDPGSTEWATPVLFMRTPDGRLFEPAVARAESLSRSRLIRIGKIAAVLAVLGIALGAALAVRNRFQALGHNNAGVLLSNEKHPEEARQEFQAALRLEPSNAAAHANLAALEAEQGNFEEALIHYRAAVASQPRNPVHHYNLGSLYARMGNERQALESLVQAVELDSGYAQAYNELGALYLRLGDLEQARRELGTGLKIDPGSAPLHKNLGELALAEGDERAALRHLQEALRLWPLDDELERAKLTYRLAEVYARGGRKADVCRQLSQLLEPERSSVLLEEARALAEENGCTP